MPDVFCAVGVHPDRELRQVRDDGRVGGQQLDAGVVFLAIQVQVSRSLRRRGCGGDAGIGVHVHARDGDILCRNTLLGEAELRPGALALGVIRGGACGGTNDPSRIAAVAKAPRAARRAAGIAAAGFAASASQEPGEARQEEEGIPDHFRAPVGRLKNRWLVAKRAESQRAEASEVTGHRSAVNEPPARWRHFAEWLPLSLEAEGELDGRHLRAPVGAKMKLANLPLEAVGQR